MTTYHGLQRTRERARFGLKPSKRFITNAIERGRGAETFTAKERDYLIRQEAKGGCRALMYNTYCFIVSEENYCITMYPVPKWFGKKEYHDGKRKIKDIKKYMRHYNISGSEEVKNMIYQVS